jgi:hypothetical protein
LALRKNMKRSLDAKADPEARKIHECIFSRMRCWIIHAEDRWEDPDDLGYPDNQGILMFMGRPGAFLGHSHPKISAMSEAQMRPSRIAMKVTRP